MALDIQVASPCTASWHAMTGNDRVRHCDRCNLDVYNFSEMTEKEVKRLLSQDSDRICGRIYRRADGTMLTRDCPVGFRTKVRRISRIAGAALSAAAGLGAAAAQDPAPTQPTPLVQIQQATTELKLVVMDASGAIVPSAEVSVFLNGKPLINDKTDSEGRFTGLVPAEGHYRIGVHARGFMEFEYSGPIISRQKIVARLEVGQVVQGGPMFSNDVDIATVPMNTTKDLIPEPAVFPPPQESVPAQANSVRKFLTTLGHKLGI